MALELRHDSLEAFLAWEHRQPDRYERVGGVVRMMTGGTINHNRITLNLADALRQRLRDGSCETFTSDVKVVSPEGDVISGRRGRLWRDPRRCDHARRANGHRRGAVRQHGRSRPRAKALGLSDDRFAQALPARRPGQADRRGGFARSGQHLAKVIHRDLGARIRLEALDLDIGLDEVFARVALASPPGEPSPPSRKSAEA